MCHSLHLKGRPNKYHFFYSSYVPIMKGPNSNNTAVFKFLKLLKNTFLSFFLLIVTHKSSFISFPYSYNTNKTKILFYFSHSGISFPIPQSRTLLHYFCTSSKESYPRFSKDSFAIQVTAFVRNSKNERRMRHGLPTVPN